MKKESKSLDIEQEDSSLEQKISKNKFAYTKKIYLSNAAWWAERPRRVHYSKKIRAKFRII